MTTETEAPLIGQVFAALAHEDHVEIDCELRLGEAYERMTYVVRPGTDGAPHHEALEAMLDAGDIVPTPAPPVATDLSALKAEWRSRVDRDAERCRLQFISPGAGMAMTYQEKFAQANAVATLGEDAAGAMTQEDYELQFPTLAASVGLEAETLWACAQLVLDRYALFAQVSMGVERARLGAKQAITAASDAAEVRAAYEAIVWPTPQ